MELSHERQLQIISKAWGRNQKGYCFFPWISGEPTDKRERIQSFRNGPAFWWPRDKQKILAHMTEHVDDDLYWCPSLFEVPKRQTEHAMDEHALWADLDVVDPHTLKGTQYEPTIAWETSPGRYQALWVLAAGDIQGASWPGQENQRLTYHLGADKSGWDTEQILRIPGWRNHKPEYKEKYGRKGAPGKLLWVGPRYYQCDEFTDLPEVEGAYALTGVLEGEVDRVDRHEVWARVRLSVTKTVRDYLSARETTGDRSDVLWQIERELADAGCSVAEIVAIARASVWNKFAGRADELKRLTIEAQKAIAQIPAKVKEAIEEEWEDKPKPTNLFTLLKDVKPPKWLVKDLFAEGTCGFIAGQPKSYKSWIAQDLVFSVATGMRFLDHFHIVEPGPVLYIQEEDALPMVKHSVHMTSPSKKADKIVIENGEIMWLPPADLNGHEVPIDAYIGEQFVVSNEGWQSWLDETLNEGNYRLVVFDPLMMMLGDVDENAKDMMQR